MLKTHHMIGAASLALVAAGILALDACAQNVAAEPPGGPPAFDLVDANKDGTISKAEFQAFVAHMPVRVREHPGPGGPRDGHFAHHMVMDVAALDKNGDGKVSLDEFSAPMKTHFAELDTDHDGFLEQSELPPRPRDDMPPAPPPEN
ncbi:MAG: EF-hand domain-containing protein [Asticcacaulis sp.]|nr:EF-hand domain-containing protein [Asticcacaulis sp.]